MYSVDVLNNIIIIIKKKKKMHSGFLEKKSAVKRTYVLFVCVYCVYLLCMYIFMKNMLCIYNKYIYIWHKLYEYKCIHVNICKIKYMQYVSVYLYIHNIHNTHTYIM